MAPRTPVLLVTLLLPATAPAALRAWPPQISLTHAADVQSLVVQQRTETGLTSDLSGSAKVSVEPATLATWDAAAGLLRTAADGSGTVTLTTGGESVRIPLTVSGATSQRPVSYRLDVSPVFFRAGCNSGSCHGSARGQDGFHLSLFGYDPAGDYFRITREMPGRRIDLEAPEQSLLLEKATGAVTHTGGELFTRASESWHTLHRWLQAGAPDDAPGTPEVTGIRLYPDTIQVRASGSEPPAQQVMVMADYSDGTARDVTRLALFLANNESTAAIGKDGIVQAGASGGGHVFARFDKYTTGTEVIVLPETPLPSWPDLTPANFVDEAVFARLAQLQIPPSPVAEDSAFLRRVTLDLSGRPPTPEKLTAFTADPAPDKRARVIDDLLASSDFTDLWTMKWAEILQIRSNNQNGDGNRTRKGAWKYYQWLRTRIAENQPFDRIVRDLISSTGSTLDHPAANFYTVAFGQKRTPNERAEDTAQLFLGTRIQCAQCHNHPFDRWTMDDYYGFTAFFNGLSTKRGATAQEVFVFNQNERSTVEHPVDGRKVGPRYLGGEAAPADGQDPRPGLAQWLTDPANKAFSRTLANRAWAHLFGRGIIEPVDDGRISNPPSNEALLAALAKRLTDSGYDIRALIRDICNSRTYQLSSSAVAGNEADSRYFSHAQVRRLQAEVLLDTVSAVTGYTPTFNGQMPGTRAIAIFDGGAEREYFLKSFGSSKRETVCSCEVRMDPTLTQTLHLINGSTIDGALQRSTVLKELTDAKLPPEEAVTALYRRALSREPTGYELTRFLSSATDDNLADPRVARKFYEDVLWALMNSTEFAFNH